MRALRILGWVIAVLVLLVVAAGIALWLGGGPVLAWAIEHPVSTMEGRQIKVNGPLTIHWGAPTRIIAEDVYVANAPWSSEGDMFRAKRVEIDLFMRTLIFGPLRIPLISLDGARLVLEKSKQGEPNWNFLVSSAAPKKRHQFPDLRRFNVTSSELRFHNAVTEARTDIGVAKLDLKEADPTKPVEIAAEGTFQHAPMRIAGSVGPIAELRNPAQPYPIKFDGALDQIRLAIDGTMQKPLDFAGLDLRLSLSGAKLHELAGMLGVPLPELPDFRSTAKLTGGNGSYELQALTLKTGHSDLEGGIAINTKEKVPQLTANLTSKFIDLADFKGLYGGKPARSSAPTPQKAPEPSGRILPDSKIEVRKFPGVNAVLNFDATGIKSSGGVPFERVSLGLALENGTLTMKQFRFHVAQGDVDLAFAYTPFTQEGPPHLRASIDVRHIDLHELFGRPSMPALLQPTAGVVGGFIKIDTNGTSMRDFLGRMNGDAGLFIENGQISALLEQLAPIDVLGALGVYISGDHPVEINCFMSRFDVKAGIATASTLLLDTGDVRVTGEGNLNFADETVTMKLTPANKSFTVVSLRTPVDISGTFKKPAYHLETGALIARLGAAIGLGVAFPPAAILPLVDTGLGPQNACSRAYAAQKPPQNPPPATGSSQPKR